MESTCFGFEETDEPIHVINDVEIVRPTKFVKPTTFRFACIPSKTAREIVHLPEENKLVSDQTFSPVSSEEPVSITHVQELLLQDLNPGQYVESVLDDETSFYEDESTEQVNSVIQDETKLPIKTKKRKGPNANANQVNDTVKLIIIGRKRSTNKNDMNENVETRFLQKTPARVFTRPTRNKRPLQEIQNVSEHSSLTKLPKNVMKKKERTKNAENEKNEQFEKLAEQINFQFKQVEEFQLLVE